MSSSPTIGINGFFFIFMTLVTIWDTFYRQKQLSFDIYDIESQMALPRQSPPSSSSAAAAASKTKATSFLDLALTTHTDKVEGYQLLEQCLKDPEKCAFREAEREACRPWGHFYDTLYQRWLSPLNDKGQPPIQFLEIGFHKGNGYETFAKYLAQHSGLTELHSIEASCAKGLPPHKNEAKQHAWYSQLREESQNLHCGDPTDYDFLYSTWNEMNRGGDAHPLTVVVDDGSKLARSMADSLFFWFPKIAPGGIMVVEDIQPIEGVNKFRTHIVPQIMKDLHWCGKTSGNEHYHNMLTDQRCFPTLQPLMQGVHCEMHICVFVRNDQPSVELPRKESLAPPDAFTGAPKCLFGPHE